MAIAVFDSGVGGLSVLKELKKKFPQQDFVYLGDTARLPYGTKSKETITKYLFKSLNYLKEHYDLKAMVVACNSASTVLDQIQSTLPLIGVIESSSKDALKKTKSKKIALWATQATVDSQEYHLRLTKEGASLHSTACPTLVSLVEEAFDSHPLLEPAFEYYLSFVPKDCDCLILGCTHFPHFKQKLADFLQAQNRKLELADFSSEISSLLKPYTSLSKTPKTEILITDTAPHFLDFIEKALEQNENIVSTKPSSSNVDESSYSIKKVEL